MGPFKRRRGPLGEAAEAGVARGGSPPRGVDRWVLGEGLCALHSSRTGPPDCPLVCLSFWPYFHPHALHLRVQKRGFQSNRRLENYYTAGARAELSPAPERPAPPPLWSPHTWCCLDDGEVLSGAALKPLDPGRGPRASAEPRSGLSHPSSPGRDGPRRALTLPSSMPPRTESVLCPTADVTKDHELGTYSLPCIFLKILGQSPKSGFVQRLWLAQAPRASHLGPGRCVSGPRLPHLEVAVQRLPPGITAGPLGRRSATPPILALL